jgi:Na+-translocating ferredoxin:NAD+ oxidoreductase subunit B
MDHRDTYDALRRHLDSLPVGFPKSASGMRILRRLFTEPEARLALALDSSFKTAATIDADLAELGYSASSLAADAGCPDINSMLRSMASKGSLLMRSTNDTFALLPFVVGMYEMQISRLTRELCDDTSAYMHEGYGLELLTTGTAQTRVIPVGASIRPEQRIADYDEYRSLIRGAGGRIAVLDCVCRRGADLAGKPCKSTDRRELCMVFRDFADTVLREGWGKPLSEAEALELADLNQLEGLVMRPSNEREPQFLCACCSDCCGLIAVVKAMKRPADFVATNHCAALSVDACIACGACARLCPMEAIVLDAKPAGTGGKPRVRLLGHRCIGCGVCVAACKTGALVLEALPARRVPPKDTEELLGALASTKPSKWRRLSVGVRGILGFHTRPHA